MEEEGGESDEEESKGLKRKREEMHREEEAGPSTEKKRVRNLWLMVHLQLRAKTHCKTTILSHSNMVRCRNLIAKLLRQVWGYGDSAAFPNQVPELSLLWFSL